MLKRADEKNQEHAEGSSYSYVGFRKNFSTGHFFLGRSKMSNYRTRGHA